MILWILSPLHWWEPVWFEMRTNVGFICLRSRCVYQFLLHVQEARDPPYRLIIKGMFRLLMRVGAGEVGPTMAACSTPNKNHMSSSRCLLTSFSPPRPQPLSPSHPTPWEKRGSWEIQKHMWLAIKLHMHSVYPNPRPRAPIAYQRSAIRHTSNLGEESYIRGDVETMGREEATSGNNLCRLWQGAKTKMGGERWRVGGWSWGGRWQDNGDSQKEGDCRLPFLHGPRTMLILWHCGARLWTRWNLRQT